MIDPLCILPWTHIMVGMAGEYRICNAQSRANWQIFDKNGNLCTVMTHTPQQAIESINHEQIREKFLNADWPGACRKCRDAELIGGSSLRTLHLANKHWQGGAIEILGLDLRLGNFCNARCVFCGPTNSTGWYADHVALRGELHFFGDLRTKISLRPGTDGQLTHDSNALNWWRYSQSWKNLQCADVGLLDITFSGGEPLLINEHLAFLEQLVTSNQSSKINITYKTNLSILPVHATAIWQRFKSVKFVASIDGINDAFSYLRYPLHWQDFLENISLLKQASQGAYILEMGLTLGAVTLLEMASTCEWINNNWPGTNIVVNNVQFPQILQLGVLPKAVRARAAERIKLLPTRYSDKILPYLMSSRSSPISVDQLKSFLDNLDKIRNTNWTCALPELSMALSL